MAKDEFGNIFPLNDVFKDFFGKAPGGQSRTVHRVMTHDLKENVMTVLHQGYLSVCNANAARDIFRTFTEEDMQQAVGFTFNAASVYVDSVQQSIK